MTGKSKPIPSDGRIDPAQLDTLRPKGRRPKLRNRPEPSDELRAAEPAMRKKAGARPIPPGVMLEPGGANTEHWTAPHADTDLWTLQLAEAFGTRSMAVLSFFMTQLDHLCQRNVWDDEAGQWRLDENEFSAVLALVNTVKPRNEIEAALAAQMVAVHLMMMATSVRALQFQSDPQMAAVASKLARTFTTQIETLQGLRKPRRTARQSITVRKETHQHVHLHTTGGGDRNEAQPQDPGTLGVIQTLQGEEQGGTILRLPSGQGQGRMQTARGTVARSAEGAG